MKQHDWIIANMNNPTFTVGDFQTIADMTLENTQLLSKDKYLQNEKVRSNPMFQDNNGEFSEDKFNKFYENSSNSFKVFSTEQVIDNYEYDLWDIRRPKNGRIKNSNFSLITEPNPSHMSIGISGINKVEDSNISMRELAQNSKIYDTKTGEFLEDTVNDISLFTNPIKYFKSLESDPLVYATYDKDTVEIDKFTGKLVEHKKGDWKVNDDGEYYTEILNGRSLIGKEIVSSLDYITSENSKANKYDFFDSDGVDKSIGGTIMKGIATVVPLFIPYVDIAYSGYLVAREISKSLPMLYGIVTGISGQEKTDSKLLNTIAAYGQKFTSSTSDYSKSNVFSFENFGNLLSDVATQWGQQQFVAQGIANTFNGAKRILKGAETSALNKYIQASNKADLMYKMGLISEADLLSYTGAKTIKEVADLTKAIRSGNLLESSLLKSKNWINSVYGQAAWKQFVPKAQKIAEKRMRLGGDMSLAYMSIVSNTDVYDSILQKGGTPFEAAAIALGSTIGMFAVDKYLGLGEMFFQTEPARAAIRTAARNSVQDIRAGLRVTTQSNPTKKGLIGLIEKGISAGKKAVESLNVEKLKSLGVVGKSLGEGLEEVSEELVTDMSKSLGELAGQFGIFSQTDYGAWENAFDRYTMSFLGGTAGGAIYGAKQAWQTRNDSNQFQSELTYLIRNGRKDDILKEFKKLRDKGQLASTNLSFEKNESGTYLTADTKEDSQNETIYKSLVSAVNQIDLILNDNDLNLSDDLLFDQLVQGEMRKQRLTEFLNDGDQVKNMSYITKFYDDFNKLEQDIINKQSEIDDLEHNTPDPNKRGEAYGEKLNKLKRQKKELLDQKNYLFGEGSLGYVDKLLFAMDKNLSSLYLDLSFEEFVKSKGKDISQLTQAEQDSYKQEYDEYSANQKQDLDVAFNLYKQIGKILNPEVQKYSEMDFKVLQDMLDRLDEFQTSMQNIFMEKFEDETEEQFNSRDKKLENESEEEFKERQNKLIDNINAKKLQAVKKLLEKPIDSSIRRLVHSQLGVLRNEILDAVFDRTITEYNSDTNQELKEAFRDYYSSRKTQNDWQNLQNKVVEIVRKHENKQMEKQISKNIRKDNNNTYEKVIAYISEYLGNSGYFDPWNDDNPYLSRQLISDFMDTLQTEASASLNKDIKDLTLEEIFSDPIWKSEDKDTQKTLDDIIRVIIDTWSQGYNEDNADDFIFQSAVFEDADTMEVDLESIYFPIFTQDIDILKNPNGFFQATTKSMENFQQLEQLDELDNSMIISNPVISLIDFIFKNVSGQNQSLEDTLSNVHKVYSKLSHSEDYELSETQIKLLNDAVKSLELAQSFLYSAYQEPSMGNPIGHNKSLNRYANNHKDVFKDYKELPEIDEQIGKFLVHEIQQYINEVNTWIRKHEQNLANRARRFDNAEKNLINTQEQFFNIHKDKLIVDGVNLLEGINEITDTGFIKVIKSHMLFRKNYQKLKDSGKSDKDIIKQLFGEDGKIINFGDLASQQLARLDEYISYDKLSDYDKFQFIISSLAINDLDYYNKLLEYVDSNQNFGPIAIQEYVSRLQQAQQNSPELINAAMEWLKEVSGTELQYLPNTTITVGSAGSGKTTAVAAVSTNNGVDTWITAPTKNQIINLNNSLKEAKAIDSYEELVFAALGKDQGIKFLQEVNSEHKDDSTYQFFSVIKSLQNNATTVLTIDESQINTIDNAPKTIVIDEATHIPVAVHELLSMFAKKNNINLLLLGDNNQNGKTIKNKMSNIEFEQILAWRTPKLYISLRDNNNQKQENLSLLNGFIDYMDAAGTVEEASKRATQVHQDLANSFLSFHTKTGFFGEVITDEIDPKILSKIGKDASIAIISEDLNSKYLKDFEGYTNVIVINPMNVQGSEYDYVVIDLDLGFKKFLQTKKNVDLFQSIKNLYTMISRSRYGSIITDTSLLALTRNKEDSTTGTYKILDLVKTSRDKRITKLRSVVAAVKDFLPTSNNQTLDNQNSGSDKQNKASKNQGDSSKAELDKKKTNSPNPNNNQPQNITIDDETKEIIDSITDDETIDNKGNKEINDEESQDAESRDIAKLDIKDPPVRVYGNASYSGIDISNEVWNGNGSKTDLDIFIKGDIKTPDQKYNLVHKLYQLKSLLLFGTEFYDLASEDVTQMFNKEDIENAEFYVRVEDDSPNNKLIGLTTLKNTSEEKLINNKIVKVVAKIKGKDGNIYTVSLGALANPKTWESNKNQIIENIRKSIDKTDDKDKKERLLAYINSLGKNIEDYRTLINNITKGNIEYRINRPIFSKMTDLVKENYRLEDINSDYSQWDKHTKYAISSDIYIEDGNTPGIKSSKGRAVIYVTSNPFLKASSLRDQYAEQKLNPGKVIPSVRQIVLDNVGVSWESLMKDKYILSIYQRKLGDMTFNFPFESRRITPKMYIALWNFRANLQSFLERFNEAKKQGGIFENYTDDQITEAIYLDNRIYQRLSKNYSENISEAQYRTMVENEVKNKSLELIKKIWKFNDSLADSVRQFRLGGEHKHGAYLRKITNLKEGNTLYKDINNVIGIYISPQMANYYSTTLDQIFTEVIDKVIPPIVSNKQTYINKDLAKNNANWFQELKEGSGTIKLEVKENSESGEALLTLQGKIAVGFPALLIQIAKKLDLRQYTGVYYNIKSYDSQGKEIKISLDEQFGSPFMAAKVGDEITLEEAQGYENEGIYISDDGWIRDHRFEDMFNLAFHGLFSTTKENDFITNNDIRATDAIFKKGFFIDPVFEAVSNTGQKSHRTITNRKLFRTDRIPGLPKFTISLKEYTSSENTEVQQSQNNSKSKETQQLSPDQIEKINSINAELSKIEAKLTDKQRAKLIQGTLSVEKILKDKYKFYFRRIIKNSNFEGDIYYLKDNKIIDLKEYARQFGEYTSISISEGDIITITYENGELLTLQESGEDIIEKTPKNRAINDNLTIGGVISNVLDLLNNNDILIEGTKILDILKDVYINEYNKLIKFKDNIQDWTNEAYGDIINPIIEAIQEIKNDYPTESNNLNKLIDSINNKAIISDKC